MKRDFIFLLFYLGGQLQVSINPGSSMSVSKDGAAVGSLGSERSESKV